MGAGGVEFILNIQMDNKVMSLKGYKAARK
jgi:hypothetical protein